METSSKNNSYELISMTESDDSFSPQPIPEITVLKSPNRRRKARRRPGRNRNDDDSADEGCCMPQARVLSISFIIVVLSCWLLALTWMVIIFNGELRKFDNDIMSVVTGNEGLPDTLRRFEKLSKELEKNQTDLNSRMEKLDDKLDALTSQMNTIAENMPNIRQISNISHLANSLKTNMSVLNSDLKDLNITVSGFINTGFQLDNNYRDLNATVTSLNNKLSALGMLPKITNSTADDQAVNTLISFVRSLTMNISLVNESLAQRIESMNDKFDKFSDDHIHQSNKEVNEKLSKMHNELEEQKSQIATLVTAVQNFSRTAADSKIDTKQSVGSKLLNNR